MSATGTLAPWWAYQYFDDAGLPLNGGLMNIYAAGTTTRADTYTSYALVSKNTNPIVLDAFGRPPNPIFIPAASFKVVLTTSAGISVGPTLDSVNSVGLQGGPFEMFAFAGDPTSPITGTSYPSGTTYDKCHAGTAWFVMDSGNLPSGTFELRGMLLAAAGTTVTAALVNLSDGAPDTPLVTISSTSTTGESQVSAAITFATPGVAKTYAIKTKVSANSGYAWALTLIKVA